MPWVSYKPGASRTNVPSNAATNYNVLDILGASWTATEANVANVVGASGPVTISNWAIKIGAAPGGGKSWTFTLRVNGVDSALVVTISGASATTGSDTAHSVVVQPGDLLTVSCVPTGTPAAMVSLTWVVQRSGSAPNNFAVESAFTINAGQTYIMAPDGGGANNSIKVEPRPAPEAAEIGPMYVYVPVAPGGSESITFTLQKTVWNGSSYNAVADTVVVATVTGANKSANSLLTASFAQGDMIGIKVVSSAGAASTRFFVGYEYRPATFGNCWILGECIPLTPPLDNFTGTAGPTTATEALVQMPMHVCTMRGFLGAICQNATTYNGIGGTSFTMTVRQNGADTPLAFTGTTGIPILIADSTHTIPFAEGDTMNFRIQTSADMDANPIAHTGVIITIQQVPPAHAGTMITEGQPLHSQSYYVTF